MTDFGRVRGYSERILRRFFVCFLAETSVQGLTSRFKMKIVTVLSVVLTIASAADYAAVDPVAPPSYVPEKPVLKPLDLALIVKLLEQLRGYGAKYAEPEEDSYPASYPDLSKLLKLLLPKKHALKTTYSILNRLPGLYGDLPPYALNPALLSPAYRPHPLGLGLLPPYAGHPLNLLYPPAAAPYHLPPAHKLPLNPAGLYGLPGYAPPALALPPVIVITKEVLDALKGDDYAEEALDVVEAPAPAVYVPKAKKVVIASPAAYAPAKAVPAVKPVKTYAKAVKVVKVPKAAVYAAKAVKPAKVYVATAAPLPAAYAAADALAPAAAYAAPAPDATYEEARSAGDAEPKTSPKVASSAKNADSASQSSSGGESARSSLSDHGISSQQTVSRIS